MTKQEIEALGYILKRHVTDCMGIKHRFGVYPVGPGGTNYFDDLTSLREWKRDVELLRAIQAGDDTLFQRRQNYLHFKAGGWYVV